MENGEVSKVEVTSEKGGEIVLENPFGTAEFYVTRIRKGWAVD
jgi:hypothetical protein